MCPKDADKIANSVDSDQTAPLGSSLIRFYTLRNLGLHCLLRPSCPIFSSPGQSPGRAIVQTPALASVAVSALAKC